jgi:hypothetical protein
MMKKLYEAYKLNTKKKIDEFNEAARKIISDKEYPEAEDILKLVEGAPITDNHERRIHDPSIYKLHGKVLNAFFDEPYPVMMPEDVKMMRGMSDEMTRKFQEYVESETGIPRETLVIDSIPENVREKAEHDAVLYGDSFIIPVRYKDLYDIWIDSIRDPEIDILTGCTKNFKPQQKIDMLEAVFNVLDADKPDRNGRIWQKELLMKQLMKPMWMIPPRHHKSWMWMKLLQMQSYEIQQRTLMNPPSTKWDINSVIHMRWPKPDLSDLKPEVGKIDDLMLIDYFTNTFGPIDQMTIHSFMRHWPELVKKTPGPNLNNNGKKQLERVIKKARKHK